MKSLVITLFFIFFINTKYSYAVTNEMITKSLNEKNEIIQQILEDLVSKLTVYKVSDHNGPIELIRHGKHNDGGYVIPRIAFEKADVLLGYGIADDISFEEIFSTTYQKPSFGFDCGVETIHVNNNLCTFISECIASDSSVYEHQKSSGKFSTFSDQIKRLNIENKKIFIKMDIEGSESAAFETIKDYFTNITGIVLEIHFKDNTQITLANRLLDKIEKDFFLVHVHANNCEAQNFQTKNIIGTMPKVIELTFINKSLVTNAVISEDNKYPLPIDMKNCEVLQDYKFEIVKK